MMKALVAVCGVVLFSAFQPREASGQPNIASVSGTVSDGSLVTIRGTQLHAEAKLNWDGFFVVNPNAWSFEGTSPSADNFSDVGPSGGTYDGTVKLLGAKSMKFHAQGASSNCPSGNIGDYNAFFLRNPGNDLWIRMYVRWRLNGGGWPRGHIKMVAAAQGFYFQPHSDMNGNLPTQFNATYDGKAHYALIPSGQLQNNRWYAVELHLKNGSPTTFAAWVDGTQILNNYDVAPGGSIDHLLFGLVNLCDTSSTFSLDHWVDGLVVARSRVYPSAIVEVGNSSTYATARRNVQAVEQISDDQIVFRLNTANLGAGPYYVWVRNNAQALSNAVPLGIQAGTPAAPKNIRIVSYDPE